MKKFERSPAPDFLKKNAQKWSQKFVENRQKNPSFTFQWVSSENQKVNQLLLPFLEKMTQEHCSFCDGFPFTMSKETIEHFRPKSAFPELCYDWDNLFLCCSHCQASKLEQFDEKLLKPDEQSYQFEDFFECNYSTGEVLPNSSKSTTNQERAAITIKLYDLNNTERCKDRLRWFGIAQKQTLFLDDCPYRYFLA